MAAYDPLRQRFDAEPALLLPRTERDGLSDRFGAGPQLLRAACICVPREAQQRRLARDKCSAHEVVKHCADRVAYAHPRIRLRPVELKPLIVNYDEHHSARVFDCNTRDPDLQPVEPR